MEQQKKVQVATRSAPSEESPNSTRLSSQYCNCKIGIGNALLQKEGLLQVLEPQLGVEMQLVR